MANKRHAPILVDKEEFKKTGYQLIDTLANFFDGIADRPVTAGLFPKELRHIIEQRPIPQEGTGISQLMEHTADKLIQYSLFNGHPKFMGYITASPAPLGALADMLASAINPNVGAQILSPVATEIEKQTIQWLAELIGLSPTYGGVLVSGGNMANFTGYLAGMRSKIPKRDSSHLPKRGKHLYYLL
jgi:aromatic-L-amino-acid decarboxylase